MKAEVARRQVIRITASSWGASEHDVSPEERKARDKERGNSGSAGRPSTTLGPSSTSAPLSSVGETSSRAFSPETQASLNSDRLGTIIIVEVAAILMAVVLHRDGWVITFVSAIAEERGMSFLRDLRRTSVIWTLACLAAAPASAQLRSATYVSGLTSPVAFVQDPSNASLQFVLELGGVIRVIQNGALLPTPFATISPIGTDGERGLLGLAFSPNYASSRRLYVCFTNTSGHITVARLRRSAGNPLVSDGSRLIWYGRAANRSSGIPSAITTAATSPSVPTAISISASVTAAVGTTRITTRRIQARSSERCSASM